MTGPEPQVVQADLTVADVRQLVADLAAHGAAIEVLVKGAATEHVREGVRPPALRDVPSIVQERTACGIQLRYHFDGSDWTDTLMIVPAGARLVRIRH